MDKNELATKLNQFADLLKPFVNEVKGSALAWDGREYAKPIGTTQFDPYALAWWTKMRTAASLLEGQSSSLSNEQVAYLRGAFFGGMGSLIDFIGGYRADEMLYAKLSEIERNLNENLR